MKTFDDKKKLSYKKTVTQKPAPDTTGMSYKKTVTPIRAKAIPKMTPVKSTGIPVKKKRPPSGMIKRNPPLWPV